jgi:hypothetical protein
LTFGGVEVEGDFWGKTVIEEDVLARME